MGRWLGKDFAFTFCFLLLVARSCTPTFNERRNLHSVGGVRSTTLTTVDSCKNWCAGEVRCVAVDWDANTDTCWVHTSANNLRQIYGYPNVTQYEVVTRCLTAPPTPGDVPSLSSCAAAYVSTFLYITNLLYIQSRLGGVVVRTSDL